MSNKDEKIFKLDFFNNNNENICLSSNEITTKQNMPNKLIAPAKTTDVYDTYWKFATERQEVFFRRAEGLLPPWSDDPILRKYKFTNAYRASDRISQYLIRNVIYPKQYNIDDTLFRILIFKFFNKIETWEALESKVGEIKYSNYNFNKYSETLSNLMESGKRIYSAAYIMPSAKNVFGFKRKHKNHLKLIEKMMENKLATSLQHSNSMESAFELLKTYPMIGDFLAYQFVTDINYSELTNFDEMEFVLPGPGAKRGIQKCFSDLGGMTESEIIKKMAEIQKQEFSRLGLDFKNLWGRQLQLIDCQNLFCEVDKYSRVAHPDLLIKGKKSRIKQKFRPINNIISYWFPPKWGINKK